jgi:hypothetical protein
VLSKKTIGRVRPPLQDEEHAARAAARAAKAAAPAATKAATGKTSRHLNVCWHSGEGKWRAQVWGGSTPIHLGYFDDQDAAGKEADKWTREKHKEGDPLRKLNFDSDGELAELHSTDSSKYRGVYPEKKTGRWVARIWDGTSQVSIGTFATQEEAAKAYDARALALGKPTNLNQYGECNPAPNGKVVPQHDKWDGRHGGIPPRPRGGG